jgi:hypothetical protein
MTEKGTAEKAAERRCRCTYQFQPHEFKYDADGDGWFAMCPMCEREVWRDGLPWRPMRGG